MNYLVVAVAGFFGAIVRKLISGFFQMSFLPGYPVIPFGTLFINISGSFVLSLFMTVTANRFKISPSLRLGVGTGFLGAYTTFSTFSVETINLMLSGQVFEALIYLFLTPVGCVMFAWAGYLTARFLCRVQNEIQESE